MTNQISTMSQDMITLVLCCVVTWFVMQILTGKRKLNMPSTDIELFEIEATKMESVDRCNPVCEQPVCSLCPIPESEAETDEVTEREKRKKKKEKAKKKRKKLAKLKSECVMALRSLGVKASEAPRQVERAFKKNKKIKSVEEFLRSI